MSSIDGERSPKRPRLESYSPASPPLDALKAFIPAQRTPNTPPPSVRMSPSWQPQSLATQNPSLPTSVLQPNIPTPPSTAGFNKQMKRKRGDGEDGGSDHATPATDAGTDMQTTYDADMSEPKAEDDVEMVDAEHRRTDHERDAESTPKQLLPLYKLDSAITVVEPMCPAPGANLLQLYDLDRIQSSVARRDPVTGEKINRMRKSYENKVKSLSLAGRNKATPNQGELDGLLDPLWSQTTDQSGLTLFQQHHQGRELGDNPSFAADLFAKADEVWSTIDKVPFPKKENDTWLNLLGLDEASKAAAAAAMAPPSDRNTPQPGPAAAALAKTAPLLARSATPASPRNAARPERTGKKRRYDESSYSGYEGYEDNDQPLKQRMRV